MSDSIGWGYYVGDSENPTNYSVNKSNTDTLYYPHNNVYEKCEGYWLDSPSAYLTYNVMFVSCGGGVNGYSYNSTIFAFRPVVCLPSNILQ